MEYKKIITDGYILGLAKIEKNGNINKEEFDHITDIIHSKPVAPDGYDYHLKADLQWELYKLPPVEEEEAEDIDTLKAQLAEIKEVYADEI